MRRVAKPEGQFNIVIEEVEKPQLSPVEVLVRSERTLISRGSEIWRRYVASEAIDAAIMGYSQAGVVAEVGEEVSGVTVGDRVATLRPHAEFVVVDTERHAKDMIGIPDDVSAEAATFWPLATSAVRWMEATKVHKGQTMVVLGQGLVGSICMQVAKRAHGAHIIAVDALPLRCELATRFGADDVVDISVEDPVEAVARLTEGEGADFVIEAVGGRAGAGSFAQAQDMVKRGGLIQVLGLYEDEPLPLDSSKIQGKRILGGMIDIEVEAVIEAGEKAMAHLRAGVVATEEMVTHRMPFTEAAAAFDLLYNRLGETMAVTLVWDDES